MRHLIDVIDFAKDELDALLSFAGEIIANPGRFADSAQGKILATLFFEPSTRTRLSFESAMLSLGGNVIGFSDSSSSSAVKGESLGDTVQTVSCYSDIIAMRHPKEGAAMAGAMRSAVPIINAGDGGHSHPTQTLTDLLTLKREKGGIDGLTVGMCGDLKYGRTVHSLINALGMHRGIKLVFISPAELAIPSYMKSGVLKRRGMKWEETASLEEALPSLNVLYMTRIQGERFDNIEDYNRLKGSYVLTAEKMRAAKADMSVLHPLPRVNEISVEVDADPRAAYFRQVQNGKYVRMALIHTLLFGGLPSRPLFEEGRARLDLSCQNPRCITTVESGIRQVFTQSEGGAPACLYCEKAVSK